MLNLFNEFIILLLLVNGSLCLSHGTSPAWGGDIVAIQWKNCYDANFFRNFRFYGSSYSCFYNSCNSSYILLKVCYLPEFSRLIPDKSNLGFRFPCDGPGRGGTCQVSAWDHVFLGLFWMYNSLSIVIFHFSWKMQSDVWGNVNSSVVSHITRGNFAQSANTINGWLRDFLWSQSLTGYSILRFISFCLWINLS